MMLFAAGPLRWRRISVQDDAPAAERTKPAGRPAVFIDKDGTLVRTCRATSTQPCSNCGPAPPRRW